MSRINVGMNLMGGKHWTGGITYLRNLISALQKTDSGINPIVLVRADQLIDDYKIISDLDVKFVRVDTKGYKASRPLEFLRLVALGVTGNDLLNFKAYEKVIQEHRLDCIYGANLTSRHSVPSICWFPDFQHVHLPHYYSLFHKMSLNFLLRRMASNSDAMVFSSQHACADFQGMFPGHNKKKCHVLRFVADLPTVNNDISDFHELNQRYGLPSKYAYLPNQFWRHKNHLTIFRAVALLKKKGINLKVVLSGNPSDPRSPGYYKLLLEFIRDNGLQSNLFMLGMVPFSDVYKLIRGSAFLINPSLFEGWSTSVEEARIFGRPMILSGIPVHREQNPPKTLYFDALSVEDLADKLETAWNSFTAGPDFESERAASVQYCDLVAGFSHSFNAIVNSALEERHAMNMASGNLLTNI